MTWATLGMLLVLAATIVGTNRARKEQLNEIHDLVNSNLATVSANLVLAQHRIETLEKHIVDVENEMPPPGPA